MYMFVQNLKNMQFKTLIVIVKQIAFEIVIESEQHLCC